MNLRITTITSATTTATRAHFAPKFTTLFHPFGRITFALDDVALQIRVATYSRAMARLNEPAVAPDGLEIRT